MRRREFFGVLGGVAVSWPVAVRAQSNLPVVGFLSPRSGKDSATAVAAFHKGLGETDYVEGRNVTTEYRWAEGRYDRLPLLVADLIQRHATVIAAFSPRVAKAAKGATSIIPIVFTTASDPVAEGLVNSLSRPNGNATGVTFYSGLMGAKRLELLRALVSKADSIAVLLNPNTVSSNDQLKDVQEAASALGVRLHVLLATREDDFEAAFTTITHQGIDALIVLVDPIFSFQRVKLAELAALHKVPTISYERDFAEVGGLVSYGASLIDSYRQVGVYVGRILKGEKPVDLPVLQPTKFDLVINLKTAKTLGLTVPDKLMALADEVIE